MSTTEEYLDGLLQATMEQEPDMNNDTNTEKAQMQSEPETESVDKAEEPTEVTQPVQVEETPKEENIAVSADDNHKMSTDEIAALFAQMKSEPEPTTEPDDGMTESKKEPESESVENEEEPVAEPESESVENKEEPTVASDAGAMENKEETPEKIEDMLPADTEKQPEETGMSDELAALLKEVQEEPDNEEQGEPDAEQKPEDASEAVTEEKQKPQEEMEIDLSDPDAMSFLQDIREKEETKEDKKADDPVNEIEELLRKSDNHEPVDDQMDLMGEQDELPKSPAGESELKQSDQDETGDGSKRGKKKKGLISLLGKKKKKQEETRQTDDEVPDVETTAEASEAGVEESEPVADGEVHDLLQNLFGDEETSAEDFLQKEEDAGEQVTEATDSPKEKKESFWKKLGNALFEEDEEEENQDQPEQEKKKKDKKGKKKKKVTDASDNQGILDELDAEGTDDKKGKKKKNKKKPKKDKKAQTKEGPEKEDGKKLPIKMVIRIFVLAFSILALLLIVLEIIPSVWTAADARNAFYKKEYRTAYEEMTGKKLSKQDQRLYEKAKLIASMQQRYDAYTSYTALQMPVEALDSLLSGYQFWQQEAETIAEYDAATETDAVKYQILNTLYDTYQLTEDDVKQIIALDDYDYTAKLEELTGSLSHKNSDARQAGSNTVSNGDAVDADTTEPVADSADNETQTDSADNKEETTQMQDVLPEEEIE